MKPIFKEKLQFSGFPAYPNGSPSQLIWLGGVLLYKKQPEMTETIEDLKLSTHVNNE
jgi:hypothetical protein